MNQMSYRNEVAVRLNQLFDLIRVRHKDLHIATICKLLGIDDVYEFEKYTLIIPEDVEGNSSQTTIKGSIGLNIKLVSLNVSTAKETGHSKVKNKHYNPQDLIHPPKKDILEDIADIFGLSDDWLQKGKGNPFDYDYLKKHARINVLYPEECLDYRKEFPSLKYYFVLSGKKDVAIILQLSEFKFIVVPKSWTLDANSVGRTGQKQMESLCYLLERLSMTTTYGRIVSQELFDGLILGKIYPGIIEYMRYCDMENCHKIESSCWQENITDMNQSDRYEHYGDWLKESQECISFVRRHNLANRREYINGVLVA